MKIVSLVIPVFNEVKNIRFNLKSILSLLPEDKDLEYEVLIINDGSSDPTESCVEEIVHSDRRVKLLSFTRNFGKVAAILAGLESSKGDAVIIMDSDLQHPPQLIAPMIQYWQDGFLLVEAVKESRGQESFFSRVQAYGFYFLLKNLSGQALAGHSDFKLLDREVVQAYLSLPEKQKFFRGLVSWLGYTGIQIPFVVPERSGGGGSRWTRIKLLRYALKNISLFSSLPLSLVSVIGSCTLFFGFVVGLISLWQKLQGQALTGFTTVNLLIIMTGGAILFCLGIVSHYLALIYNEIKGRPLYVFKSKKK